MNREIKFRAWDKNKNKFIPTNTWAIVQTDFKAFGVMLKDWEDYREGEYFYSNSQELSQYTGLKDKNGKDIYDGDIIRQGGDLCIVQSCVGGFDCQMLIELKNGGTIEGSTYNFSFLSETYCEIIGNIYENPELL